MSSLTYLVEILGDTVTKTQYGNTRELFFRELGFPVPGEKPPAGRLTVVAAEEFMLMTGDGETDPGAAYFVAGDVEAIAPPPGPGGCVISTSLPLIELFTRLDKEIRRSAAGERQLMRTYYEKSTVFSLVSTLGQLLGAPVMLVDSGGSVIARTASLRPRDKALGPVFSATQLDAADFFALTGVKAEFLVIGRFVFTGEGDRRAAVYPFTDVNGAVTYLVALPGARSAGEQPDISAAMHDCVSYLSMENVSGAFSSAQHNSFHRFLQTVLTGNLSDDAVIDLFISNGFLHDETNRFFRLVVAEDPSGIEVQERNPAAAELTPVISVVGSCVYQGNLVMLVAVRPEDTFQLRNPDRADRILGKYHLRACVSPAIPVFYLKMQYGLLCRAISLDRVMKYSTGRSFFFLEEYSVPIICDLAAAKFADLFGGMNPTPLIEHCVGMLNRYDKLNNSNLNDTLYTYLIHGRNLGKTAEAMYMHKNTVLYKLKKIRSMMLEDIDSPDMQMRLMCAYMMLRYYEDFCGGELTIYDPDVEYPKEAEPL